MIGQCISYIYPMSNRLYYIVYITTKRNANKCYITRKFPNRLYIS